MMRIDWARFSIGASALAIYVFMYAPILVLIIYSFQDSRVLTWPLGDWSLRWYVSLAENRQLLQAIGNSLIVATSCVAITTIFGVALAMALRGAGTRIAAVLERMILMPLIVPQLVTGLAVLLVLNRSDVQLSLLTIILGQSIVWMPIVVTQVYARLMALPPEIEQAARDLGANPVQTFFLITLPSISTAVAGSALLVFTLSFDELPVTFFLTGSENTLPMFIWSMMRVGITPEINAIATITVIGSIVMIALGTKLLLNKNTKV
tara:strand:+ start:4133 stop:4924 length:792 start_codon:yes stop_codon:yes gene_type:complete